MTDSLSDPILDSINEGVFTVDHQWRITAFNRAAERITGVRRQDALGRQCSDVFRANICEEACALRRTFSSGKPVVGATVEDIVGRSAAMRSLFDILPQIAESASTVLMEGESGTGKELFARAMHHLSPRGKKRFVAVNCAALPDTLLESELFGYKAGAFTDARKDKLGRFALADGGTIFLDEIGDISPAMQVRLLRVLQERCVEPLGATEPVKINVRVLAATNKDLGQLVREGKFREDLYYRIRVVYLKIPPLRERREDVPLLVDHLVAKFNRLQEKDISGVSPDVLARLMEHGFPGNVRELENILEQAFVLCRGGWIEVQHLPVELRPSNATSGFARSMPGAANLPRATDMRTVQRQMIEAALERNDGNQRRAARELGINPSTLYRRLKATAFPDVQGSSE